MIFEAIGFAAKAHHGQFRKGTKLPYIIHVMNAMRTVYEMTEDESLMAAALLHDVVEDTEISLEELEKQFGSRVASGLYFYTLQTEKQQQSRKMILLK
jgi:GTP diphosphokinase / guanosine-3',5'-bis(diphosphate) 3'-diphosphatase